MNIVLATKLLSLIIFGLLLGVLFLLVYCCYLHQRLRRLGKVVDYLLYNINHLKESQQVEYSQEQHFINLVRQAYEIFETHGICIYHWKRECHRCHRLTSIYSYYLNCDIKAFMGSNELLQQTGLGIGYIKVIDSFLIGRYGRIQRVSTHTSGEPYVANLCEHCGAVQGRHYIVDDPDTPEIYHAMMIDEDMSKYTCDRIKLQDIGLTFEEFREIFDL